ncbi:MucB/RseB C-terminal domain-containing protein [Ectothiorhodospira shaposhnikovii]|uniref:MucB/RseB C-terminal domain-containing protein n=1 Tax=Ectothiorhodospira shaposhnikovii TaxID=1054 RepID=UPI001EE7D251|nr:MucB/RseB C-terminal domain-containing protein [Ectothiorhodospira shaposhnikovii]MCG5512641.1 MucB/RseB C-terminal domain-containing protein [Ectothiorhodospira shaposhnikovii]
MLRRLHLMCVVVALLATATAAASEQAAHALLQKMARAVDELNYEGVFVFAHDQRMETLQIIHARDERGSRERLVALTGSPREIIKDEDSIICVRPDDLDPALCLDPGKSLLGLPGVLPLRQGLDGLGENYRLRLGEQQRVAGLSCQEVSIIPRDHLRYGYQLCIHEPTGMLLQSRLLSREGRIFEQFMFTRIEFPARVADERLQPRMRGEGVTARPMETPSARTQVMEPDLRWRIGEMPPGFQVTGVSRRLMAASPHPVQHMILTDGLATVSVFVTRMDRPEDRLRGLTRSGGLHAVVLPWGEYQVTVLGEVPEATVRLIAESVFHDGENAR